MRSVAVARLLCAVVLQCLYCWRLLVIYGVPDTWNPGYCIAVELPQLAQRLKVC
jgi:hypothetical protein